MTTAEYGLSKAARSFNSRLDKSKLVEAGFTPLPTWQDTVDWNDQKYCEIWRHEWEVIQNRYLEANDRPERVDLRSYARQGLDIVPTVHEGAAVQQMEKRGIQTNIGNLNREIKAANRLIDTNRVEARFTDGSAVANRMPNCLRTSSTRYFTVGLTRRIECHRFFMATAENHCNVFCVTNWSSE